MSWLGILPFIAFPAVIGFNIFIVRFFIRRALKKIVIPELESKGLTFIDYKWAGFFPSGFKTEFTFIALRGGPAISLYIYVLYLHKGETKRVTARIDTLFYVIKRVIYSNKLS